jgi:hypothetical protein
MGDLISQMREMRNEYESPVERRPLSTLYVDWRIILKDILKKMCVRMWTGSCGHCTDFTCRPNINFCFGERNYIPYVNICIICTCMFVFSASKAVEFPTPGFVTQFLLGNLPAVIFFKINFSSPPPAAKLGPASDSSVYKLLKLASLFLLTSPITAWVLLYHTKYTRWLCKKSQISLRFQLPMIYKV